MKSRRLGKSDLSKATVAACAIGYVREIERKRQSAKGERVGSEDDHDDCFHLLLHIPNRLIMRFLVLNKADQNSDYTQNISRLSVGC